MLASFGYYGSVVTIEPGRCYDFECKITNILPEYLRVKNIDWVGICGFDSGGIIPLSINAFYGNMHSDSDVTVMIGITNTTMYDEIFYIHPYGYSPTTVYETTLSGSVLIRLKSTV